MPKPDKQQPARAAGTAPEHAVREQRLAAALRENLRRRKEQVRDRRPKSAAELPAVGSDEQRDS
jgi:hypothetical protein